MARLPRLALAGELHHVGLRGHNGAPVFIDDADRQAFLDMLRLAAAEHRVAIHAYALLDAEVHLLASPARVESLGRLMQSLGRRYVAAFNRRHGRSGTLWEGRFRSSVLDAAEWLLHATVFIESLVAAPADGGRWSSAAHHLGKARDALITEHDAYWSLGNTPFERESAHALMLSEGISPSRAAAITRALAQGAVLGDGAFLAKAATQTSRLLKPRPRGRPKSVPI
jgi:putative transposase